MEARKNKEDIVMDATRLVWLLLALVWFTLACSALYASEKFPKRADMFVMYAGLNFLPFWAFIFFIFPTQNFMLYPERWYIVKFIVVSAVGLHALWQHASNQQEKEEADIH